MNAIPVRRTTRAAAGPSALRLLACLTLLAAAPLTGAADDAPATGRGHVQPAPAAAYDTLRHVVATDERAATAPAGTEALPPLTALPLLLDTNDPGFGTSVVFGRLPSVRDLGDLMSLTSVQHVVVALTEWPAGYEALQPLAQALLPEGADLIVVLPGYPPTRSAAEAWNYLRLPLRLVLVVDGPPANRAGIDELNRIRALERVIADMPYPSRSGFERLQRPLSFRVIRP